MLLISSALTFPLGTYHYCRDGVHVAISGFEKQLRVETSLKKAWNEQELYETCYWSKQYFQTHFGKCSWEDVHDTNLVAKFNSYGCNIAMNAGLTSAYSFDEYKQYIGQKCPTCYNYFHEYMYNHQVWPLDTSHYCWDGVHVAVKGNDMILERGDDGRQSKKAWSDYTREDSCYYIRDYFHGKNKQSCDINELVSYPVRSHGDCFVAVNKNESRADITDEIQLYLKDKCSLCNGGHYYDPIYDSNDADPHATRATCWFIIIVCMILMFMCEFLFGR